MLPQLVTAGELAEKLDSNYDEVLSLARRGLIPSIKAGKHVYFSLSAVCKALRREHADEPAPELEGATA